MSGPSDSAGVPWGGRELTGTGFDGDTGEADAALASALAHPRDETSLMAALSGARLLVPIVAEPVSLVESGGLVAEKQTDMAAVTLVAPDGQRAPIFLKRLGSFRNRMTSWRSARASFAPPTSASVS